MALRPFNEQELAILASKGYDVSKYDGRPVEIPDAPSELPSAGGVAIRAAAASALPTLAGGGGFAGGFKAGMALPIPHPLAKGVAAMGGGVIGALLAAKGAAKGQEMLLPDSVKQTLAEDYQARPVTSTLGGLATLPLGGFNPGKLGQIGAGLSGIGKVIARPAVNIPLSIAERQAALNMTAGGAIGAAQEAAMQGLEGREFSPAHIALNAAIGGTFIRPNAIGRKLGFQGIPERTVDDPAQLSRTVGQHIEPEPVHELRRPTVNFTENQMEAMRRSTGLKASGEVESQKVDIKTGEEVAEKPKLVKSAKTSATNILKALENEEPVRSRETDPDILNVLVKQGKLVEKPVEAEAPKTPGIASALGEEVAGGLKEKGLSTSPSEQYVNTLTQEVLAEQNINLSVDGNLVSADGSPLKGTALLPNAVREVVVNPKLATLDTLPHEALHYFRTELEGRAKTGDVEAARLLGKWDEVSATGLTDYNQRRSVAGLKPVDAHEFAVSENGLEFVKQQFNLNKESGMQKWWNDTKALFREKYSKNATVEDLRRAINFRFVNEQTKGKFVGAAARDQQEAGDLEAYRAAQMKMSKLLKAGKMDSPEFMAAFQEAETLKNKNKGMPPVERNQPAGEGLTPEDERSLRLGKKGEGRTPYPFSEKERQLSERVDTDPTVELYNKRWEETKQGNEQRVAKINEELESFETPERNQEANEGLMRQTESPEFKKWFGDSKVVDGEGRPLVVYHGTDKDFTVFDRSVVGKRFGNVLGSGFYFGEKSAKIYGNKSMPVFISLKNPIEAVFDVRNPRAFADTWQKIEDGFDGKNQHDGAIIKELPGESGMQHGRTEYIVFNPEQIKSATGNRGTFDATNPDIRYQDEGEGLARTDSSAKSFLPGLASALDKVEQKVSAPIAQAGRNWASRRDQYTGKMQLALSDLEKMKDEVVDSAMKKMRMMFREEVTEPPRMSAEEQQAAQVMRDYYTWNVEERRANGQLIEGREAGKNPNYVPDTMNERARYTLLETPNSPEARHLKSVWTDHVMRESGGKLKREDVVRNINNYVDAMGSKDSHYTSINFGAARKAQGYGMPEVMRETSAKKALVSYGRRAANDMAFFKEIESQKEIAAALKLRDPVTGNMPPEVEGAPAFHTTQEVKNMMSWITGNVNENSIRHPFITSAARLTNNLLLGAPTGLRDLAQVPVFNVPYMNKWNDLANFAKGVLNFRAESRNALEYAARQPQIDKIVFNEIKDSPNRLLSAIQKAATFARKGQGREALENLSRDVSFSIGKEFARGNVLGAKAGHAQSKKFLERFGTLIEGDITKMEGPALEHALNQMAKNVVDATQGTYGPAGLPNFTTEGQLAPFLALTKWSIEKSNTIFKDVVKPFYTGENRIPLLTYTLGSVLTGAGIQKLNEALSGKRGSDPTLEEALAKGDAEAISLQIATLMQLGTYGGIVGDSMKILADAYKGKTPRNPLSFPLYSSAVNSADMIADAMGAIQEGEDPMDILYRLSLDLMANNVQNARIAINRLDAEETERKENFRDVRVFEELEGKRGREIPKVNRYSGMEAKEFKREKDLEKAAAMIPELVEKQKGEAESLEELRMKLRALKQNNYQTFPNPKTQPEAFQKYYQFLVKTQGAQEAQKRLGDYLRQNQVNRVKSQFVPAL